MSREKERERMSLTFDVCLGAWAFFFVKAKSFLNGAQKMEKNSKKIILTQSPDIGELPYR